MPYPITKDNAKALAKLSWEKRRARVKAQAEIAPLLQETKVDPILPSLARAMQETLSDYRNTADPKAKSALARALRDLRETWHLITGQPKPGNRKLPVEKPARLMLPSAVDAPQPIDTVAEDGVKAA